MSHTEYKTIFISSTDLSGFNLNYENACYKIKEGKINKSARIQIFPEANTSRVVEEFNVFTLQLNKTIDIKITNNSYIELIDTANTYKGITLYSDSTGLIKGIII